MSETSKSHRADCPHAASRPLLIETTAFALYLFVWKLCMAATLAVRLVWRRSVSLALHMRAC